VSIFEFPSATGPRPDGEAGDEAAPARSFDPRSIRIAAIVTGALVVLGLLVSHAARPDTGLSPALSSKIAPGAAAVEQSEHAPAPTQPSVAPVSVEDDQPASDSTASSDDTQSTWQEPQPSSDGAASSYDGKWDRKPGKGHGRWR
jgi:hypothetical protein